MDNEVMVRKMHRGKGYFPTFVSMSRITTALWLLTLLCLPAFSQPVPLLIGTYTHFGSEGIYLCHFDVKKGTLTEVFHTQGVVNPSFLALSPDKRFVYSIAGKNEDSVRAFAVDMQANTLKPLNAQSLQGGEGACHLAVDPTGKWLIVGNYGSGSVSVLPLLADGTVGAVQQTLEHQGKSVNIERQEAPHVHSINIAPNGQDVFVADLGTDQIVQYRLSSVTGQLTVGEPAFTPVTPGSGPRHLAFHPGGRFVSVLRELDATVTTFSLESGKLTEVQTIATLPEDYTGLKWSADIHYSPDGKFLYYSNRAHESLAIFKVDTKTGLLTLVGRQPVGGKTPRNFTLDPTGNWVLVANQDSDSITIFARNRRTGKLTPTGQPFAVSMPVCLVFVK